LSYASFHFVKVEKDVSLATNWKECEPIASNIVKTLVYCVEYIFAVADDENNQNYVPKLVVSVVDTQEFIQ
jgi:hypothetical protein